MRCLWWYRWTISFLAAHSNCCLFDWSLFLFLLYSICAQWSIIFSFPPPVVLYKMHWCTGTGSFVCVFLRRFWYCYFLWWFKMKCGECRCKELFLLSALYMYLNVHFTQTVNQVLHARNIQEICYQPLHVDIDYQFPHLYILINTGKKD